MIHLYHYIRVGLSWVGVLFYSENKIFRRTNIIRLKSAINRIIRIIPQVLKIGMFLVILLCVLGHFEQMKF